MNRRTRKSNAPPFVAMYHWEMELPAYRCLSNYGRALLLEFRRLYNTQADGLVRYPPG